VHGSWYTYHTTADLKDFHRRTSSGGVFRRMSNGEMGTNHRELHVFVNGTKKKRGQHCPWGRLASNLAKTDGLNRGPNKNNRGTKASRGIYFLQLRSFKEPWVNHQLYKEKFLFPPSPTTYIASKEPKPLKTKPTPAKAPPQA